MSNLAVKIIKARNASLMNQRISFFNKKLMGIRIKSALYMSMYSAGYKTVKNKLKQDNPRKPARLICKVARELVTTYSRI